MTAAAAQHWHVTNPELAKKKPAEVRIETVETEPAEQPAAAQPAAAAEQPAPVPAADEPAIEIPTDDNETQQASTARRLADRIGAAFRRWKDSINEPTSLGEAWRESGIIDARRIPAESKTLAGLWWWSNRTDRLLLFGLLLILWYTIRPLRRWTPYPLLFLIAPVLWCAARPSRRWTVYGVIFLITRILPTLVGG